MHHRDTTYFIRMDFYNRWFADDTQYDDENVANFRHLVYNGIDEMIGYDCLWLATIRIKIMYFWKGLLWQILLRFCLNSIVMVI